MYEGRLEDLLREPQERPDVEIKQWLDLKDNNDHKVKLSKGICALANHGGGHFIIGLRKDENGQYAEAPGRPAQLAGYDTDTINQIVAKYIDPVIHCESWVVRRSANAPAYPIIAVPGGHTVPLRVKKQSANEQDAIGYYVRRPGPCSEQPQTAQEWDQLIRRCVANAKDDLLNQIRLLLAGGPSAESKPDEAALVRQWFEASKARWRSLAKPEPGQEQAAGPHLPSGHYAVGFRLFDLPAEVGGAELLKRLTNGVVRLTGWPPFWVPTNRQEIKPYPAGEDIECWIGSDGRDDAAHSDFWRVSPRGEFFLIRGYQEDTSLMQMHIGEGRRGFDISLPVWRLGEVLLYAASMARQLGNPSAKVVFQIEYTGLAGRQLGAWGNTRRHMHGGQTARDDTFHAVLTAQADQIQDSLPELVSRVVYPLYERFDFAQPTRALVPEELQRMIRREP